MGVVLKIALRYFKAKKTHSAVNIISLISICGVMLASAALVCVLSVFNGFSSLMGEKLAKLDPQISISPATGKTINNSDSLLDIIGGIEGVKLAIPTIQEQALAVYHDKQMPVMLKGVPDNFHELTDIQDVILYGEYTLKDSTENYSILSIGAAAGLQSSTGFYDKMHIYAPKRIGRVNIANPAGAFRSDSLYISAIYQVDQSSYDRDMVYIPIDVARKLFDYPTQATSIEIKLEADADEAATLKLLQSSVGPQYIAKNRIMQQASVYKMVNMEKWITFVLLTFILIIAAFNVISSLSLLIIEKNDSIHTFRNLGASDQQISRIFITEGILISLAGAVAGIIIGIILCFLQQEFGIIKLSGNPNAVIVQSYPVRLLWSDIVVVFGLVSVVGLLTSLVTAVLMRSRLKRQS